MTKTCLECHSKGYANNAMQQFDKVVELYNEKYGKPARAIMQALYSEKLLTATPFDEAIEVTYWQLSHRNGTLARHGAAMASPSMTWKGMSEVGSAFYGTFLDQVRAVAGTERGAALIAKYVSGSEHHDWLNHPDKGNPILGFGSSPRPEPDQGQGQGEDQ
jgi:hypothetical protein